MTCDHTLTYKLYFDGRHLVKCWKCGDDVTPTEHHNKAWDDMINQIQTDNAIDRQEGGQHYKDMKIQPIEFIIANNLGYIEGNVIKYICRYKKKNGIEDLKKIIHYVELLIDSMEEK